MNKIIALASTTILTATAAAAEVSYVGGSYDFGLTQYNEDLGDMTTSTGQLNVGFENTINSFVLGAQLDGLSIGYGTEGSIEDTTSSSSITLYGAYSINENWNVVFGIEAADFDGASETYTRLGAEYVLNNYTFGAGVYAYDNFGETETVTYAFADYGVDGYSATLTIAEDEGVTLASLSTNYDFGIIDGGVDVFYVGEAGDNIYSITAFGDYSITDAFSVGAEIFYGDVYGFYTATEIALVGGYDITDDLSAKVSIGQTRLEADGESTTAGTFSFLIDYEFGAPSVTTFDVVPSVIDYTAELYSNMLPL